MKWEKLGLVFNFQTADIEWAQGGALTPTPVMLNPDVIRVFCGFRDLSGVSRIGYVDVDAENPARVLKISQQPVLDLGEPGCFDDNGLIMGHVEKIGNLFHLYYVGFQIPQKTKFLAFTGLATSPDLENFTRYSKTPILDRSSEGPYINAIHSIVRREDGYAVYFAAGDGWVSIDGRDYPAYQIYETTTADGKQMSSEKKLIIPCDEAQNEYRIGRPSAFVFQGEEHMFFTKGSRSGKDYFPGYAKRSSDGRWIRNDQQLGIELGPGDYDSRHLCYPRFINTGKNVFIFYNGNDMGKEGFAVAKLISWK